MFSQLFRGLNAGENLESEFLRSNKVTLLQRACYFGTPQLFYKIIQSLTMKLFPSTLLCLIISVTYVKGKEKQEQTELWNKCIDFPKLGDTCIGIYTNPNNLTLNAKLLINNKSYLDFPLQGNQVCLNDDSLLLLMDVTPSLARYAKIIEAMYLVLPTFLQKF